MENFPRLSTLQKESVYQASQWLRGHALLDEVELRACLLIINPSYFYPIGSARSLAQCQKAKDEFLQDYKLNIEALKQGEKREILPFSYAWTASLDDFYAIDLQNQKFLIKFIQPLIQVQSHYIGYSHLEHKFRPYTMGMNTIFWGVQFSYPQLFEDPLTKQALKVFNPKLYPNAKIFKDLQNWLREHTIPVRFEVNQSFVNTPIRLGKRCCSWINSHPQLQAQHIRVIIPNIMDT